MCVHVPNGPILHIPGPSISVHHVPVTLCHLSVMSLLVVAMPLISLPFICLYNAMTLCRSIMSLSFVAWSLPFISWSPMTLSSISAHHVPVPYGSLFSQPTSLVSVLCLPVPGSPKEVDSRPGCPMRPFSFFPNRRPMEDLMLFFLLALWRES